MGASVGAASSRELLLLCLENEELAPMGRS